MRFDVITLFPEIFEAVTRQGITSRALRRGLWSAHFWNPREVTTDVHRTVDDRPFGGGPGMVMMAEPLFRTLELIRASGNNGRVIAFAPGGEHLTDKWVRNVSSHPEGELVLICGRYEGIDERFLSHYVDEIISLGDFVLSGAELAACALMDAVVRQLPGAIKELSALDESFATGLDRCAALHASRGLAAAMAVPCRAPFRAPRQHQQRWTREESLASHLQKLART